MQAFQVLDIQRGDDVDAGPKDFLDVLVALGVAAAGGVGVGQLVDQRNRRPPLEQRVHVQFLQHDAAVLDPSAGHLLQFADLGDGLRPAMRLHVTDHHVDALAAEPVSLLQHVVGLAHARREAKIDFQPSSLLAANEVQEKLRLRLRFSGRQLRPFRKGLRARGTRKMNTHRRDAETQRKIISASPRLCGGFPFIPHPSSLILYPPAQTGSVILKTVFSPGWLSHWTVPPWAETISRTDGQPQPAAFFNRVSRHAEVPLEHHGQILRRDPATVVGDREHDPAVGRLGGERDVSARRRMGQRIVQQVAQGVLELFRVDGHLGQVAARGQRKLDAPIFRARPQCFDGRLEQDRRPFRPEVQLRPSVFEGAPGRAGC